MRRAWAAGPISLQFPYLADLETDALTPEERRIFVGFMSRARGGEDVAGYGGGQRLPPVG
ncbi:MAG: hypothetical protein NVS4B2_23620 [Chloroflexota bacterium]